MSAPLLIILLRILGLRVFVSHGSLDAEFVAGTVFGGPGAYQPLRSSRGHGLALRATTFVINMDRDDERLVSMDRELGSDSFTRWQAVRVRAHGVDPYKRFFHHDFFQHHDPSATPGNLGCALSHFTLLEKVSLVSPAAFVLVFEDDVTLIKPLTQLYAFVRSLPPDWDMANLGAHYPGYKPRLTRVQHHGLEFWRTQGSVAGAFAMAYKVASLPKIVELVPTVFGKTGEDPNTDSVFSALAHELNYYVVEKGELVNHAYKFESSRAAPTMP